LQTCAIIVTRVATMHWNRHPAQKQKYFFFFSVAGPLPLKSIYASQGYRDIVPLFSVANSPILYSIVASVADSLQTISQSGGKILLLVNKLNQSVITMLRSFWIKKIN
jgi:hypothetical protein